MIFLESSKESGGGYLSKTLFLRAASYYHANKMRKQGDSTK